MKRILHLLLTFSALSLFALTACSKNDPVGAEQAANTDEINIDAENGGFTTSDETVAFGDAAIANEAVDDVDPADPMSTDPITVSALNSGSFKSYIVRVTFGLLQGDSTATEVVDWSGYAEIDKGTLAVLKTIRFENTDFVQRPRDNRRKMEFTSQTRPHYDGLLLAIIDHDTTQSSVDGSFTIVAGAYSRTFAFSDLDSLDVLEAVGANGHQVSIISRVENVQTFGGGFFAGRWVKRTDNDGIFYGRWMNNLGTHAGYLRGIWGVNRNGEKVFFGKYISLNGRFRGLLRGAWGFGDRGDNGGFLRGHWLDRNNAQIGVLRGHWKSGRPGDGRGYFHGRYHQLRSAD